MKMLTEFLMLLNELNLVGFLFSCCDFVSRVVWEKTRFSCENSSVNRFENECDVRFWKMILGWLKLEFFCRL
jgi:hypothetical protein